MLELPAAERTTLHGERELDWHHWTLKGGEDLHLQTRGLNFSDPGLLLDAACQGLGIALVSERLSRPARQQGQLLPLSPTGSRAAVASAGASGERDHARVPRLLSLA